jgi:hypothetical protein
VRRNSFGLEAVIVAASHDFPATRNDGGGIEDEESTSVWTTFDSTGWFCAAPLA